MDRSPLRTLRESASLTQDQLAHRAGVSRQMIGAIEQGRHLPRVDAAVRIASALGVDVAEVFPSEAPAPVDVLTGEPVAAGTLVRTASVHGTPVAVPVAAGASGWEVADARVEAGGLERFANLSDGIVVAGCEPGLALLSGSLREGGMAAIAAMSSSRVALEALAGGRTHAAVVHGASLDEYSVPEGMDIERFHLARWRVGLAGPPGAAASWWREALAGNGPVIQREAGAGVQRAFEGAIAGEVAPQGPRVGGHVDAARAAAITGWPAVTIEPAALAFAATFHPIETHDAEIWVRSDALATRAVAEALNLLTSSRFTTQLAHIGGYDLTASGRRVA